MVWKLEDKRLKIYVIYPGLLKSQTYLYLVNIFWRTTFHHPYPPNSSNHHTLTLSSK